MGVGPTLAEPLSMGEKSNRGCEGFWGRLKQVSGIGRIFLAGVTVNSVLLLAYGFGLLFGDDVDKPTVFYSLMTLMNTLFFFYFAIDGVAEENEFEFFAFLGASMIQTLRVCWVNAQGEDETEYDVSSNFVRVAMLVAVVVFQVFYIVLARPVHRSFGWRVFEVVGGDIQLIAMYKNYLIFLSMLKFDVAFSLMLVATGFIYFFHNAAEIVLTVMFAVCVVVWSYVINYGVRSEDRRLMNFFMWPIAFVQPAYIIYKTVSLYTEEDRYEDVWRGPLVTTGAIAFCIRCVLMFYVFLAYRNFGRGLKERVFYHNETRVLQTTGPSMLV